MLKTAGLILCLLFCAAAEAPASAEVETSEKRISLLVIDVDSRLAHQALGTLDLPQGFEARAFTLKELGDDPAKAAFAHESGVLLVDVMGSELSQYVIDQGLLAGRRVLALRGSRDDSGLAGQGFIFDDALAEYYQHLSAANIRNMVKAALKLPAEAVVKLPENGLYHPEAPALFSGYDEYAKWYEARAGFDPGRPWLGLMFFSTSLIEGQREAYQDLLPGWSGAVSMSSPLSAATRRCWKNTFWTGTVKAGLTWCWPFP